MVDGRWWMVDGRWWRVDGRLRGGAGLGVFICHLPSAISHPKPRFPVNSALRQGGVGVREIEKSDRGVAEGEAEAVGRGVGADGVEVEL